MLKVYAYAKVNLYLDVVAKDTSGYHNIESVFQSIGLYDVLNLTSHPSEIRFNSNISFESGENLCFLAAKLLKEKFKVNQGVLINLEKNIPVAAGLGGGSSDAAATLVGLNYLWGLGLSREKLMEIGNMLGKDVPFFFVGGTALVKGKGEQIERIKPFPKLKLILADLGIPISTAKMYQKLDELKIPSLNSLNNVIKAIEEGDRKKVGRALLNIFERVAFKDFPQLKELKEIALVKGALGALMSGTGSCVFALADSLNLAQQIKEEWRAKGAKVFLAEAVDKGFEIIENKRNIYSERE